MTEAAPAILQAIEATYGFAQRPDFLQPVSMEIGRGECWGILGPNGAGKSTLLRLLAGLASPTRGAILFEGRSLQDMSLCERARRVAYLPQQVTTDLPTSARRIVLMGRFPHRRFGLFESAKDFEIVERALAATEATAFADRSLATLSGGEAQRVHVAAAIAQEPAVLLLDEPTASLDLCHQLGIFDTLRRLAEQDGLAVVVVTHDINLASRFCTHVLLLDDGRPVAKGTPAEVVRMNILTPVYQVELREIYSERLGGRWIVPIGPLQRSAASTGGHAAGGTDARRGSQWRPRGAS